ncbi:MAG: hypothetical protein CFE45_00650 [Burkholderiales bacterium PBB5]|nr:MAG: hypothetical protein CFE45_00650 [Burkholderiales bacterium PBB5]
MSADTVCGLRVRLIAWATIVALLGGCASPYVATDRTVLERHLKPKVLGDAIKQADAQTLVYREKVVELGESERLLSNSLLTLGAAVVAASVAKLHSSAIQGGGLLAGTVFTIGSFNTDKRRGAIYVAGMKALECSIAAVVPLALSDETQTDLNNQKSALDGALPDIAKASGAVEQWLVQAKGRGNTVYFQPAVESAQAGLGAVAAAVTKANNASTAAANRRLRAEEMGNLLVTTIKGIDTAVLQEIRGTEGSIQAVPGLVANIQTNAGLFTLTSSGSSEAAPRSGEQPNPVTPQKADAPSAEDVRVMENLGAAIGSLRQATVELDSRAERLMSLATPVNSQAAEALKLCKVETTLKSMSVTPASVSFTAKRAGTQTVLIDGGNGNYTAAFLNGPVPGLKAVVRPLSTSAVDIVADDKTVAGGYQLMIEDTTRTARQIVAVTVNAATAGDESAPQSDKVQKAIAAIAAAKSVQVNGVTVSLENPRARGQNGVVVDYRAQGGAEVTPQDVAIAVGNIPGVGSLLGSNGVEAVNLDAQPFSGLQFRDGTPLPRDQVRRVQTALCMPEAQRDGLWGPMTQTALERDRSRRRATGVRGVAVEKAPLTAAERNMLLALGPDAVTDRCKAL